MGSRKCRKKKVGTQSYPFLTTSRKDVFSKLSSIIICLVGLGGDLRHAAQTHADRGHGGGYGSGGGGNSGEYGGRGKEARDDPGGTRW